MKSVVAKTLLLGLAFTLLVRVTYGQELSHDDFFESRIRPLLIEHCMECHGAETQWGDLRVDSLERLLQGGEHGPALVPGKPTESLLLERVQGKGDLRMPPEEKTPLTSVQIDSLRQWIATGALWPKSSSVSANSADELKRRKWSMHWAFQPLKPVTPPEVKDSSKITNGVDRFIQSSLDKAGLQSSQRADRRTLIRRLYFDLIGLPPTPTEVDAFVADEDPNAYEKLVDHLLDHQGYGEHWARLWLDIARYSDTKGYVYGREEKNFIHAYVYRDWVTRAFIEDVPFDRFIQLQLAADQLTPLGSPDRAAMGFLTLGRRFLGVSHDIIDDRIDTMSRGLMAVTVSCARCHDHKYDPIPTADYYALYGVFLNSTEKVERLHSNPPTTTPVPSAWESELAGRELKLSQTMDRSRWEASQRMRSRIKDYFVAQSELEKYPQEGFDQILATTDLIPNLVRRLQMMITAAIDQKDRRFIAWQKYAEIPKDQFSQQATVVTQLLLKLPPESLHPSVAEKFQSTPKSFREVVERYGDLFAEVEKHWQDFAAKNGPPTGEHCVFPLPDSNQEELRQFLYSPNSPCEIPNEHISSIEGLFDSGTCTELWRLQGEVDRWILQPNATESFATTLIDRKTDYPTQIFRRGNPAQKTNVVPRHMLSLLPEELRSLSQGSGRLEVARAITSPNNPLTARVWVNRVWKQHFGAGLVRTPSDFGMRADPPSHPELLDWLSNQFIQSGWSTKKLHRLILLSQTYQQSSVSNMPSDRLTHALAVDAENRLLWHYTPQRMSFEMMRDSWLAISNELSTTQGGRGGELFGSANQPQRRTLYASIDRQFVPGVLRMFDFANPDLHTPQRSETTVPQQALFSMNHPFVAQRAKQLVKNLDEQIANLDDAQSRIDWLYRQVFQRLPDQNERQALQQFLDESVASVNAPERDEVKAWSYGFGEIVFGEQTTLTSFTQLPYFSGIAWQGGSQFPDAKLGWVQLSATGGHPGNDLKHAAIRRWTAPFTGTIKIDSLVDHQEEPGDGIRCTILSSRHGVLSSSLAHHSQWKWNSETLSVQTGDTIDFITDIHKVLNTDQYLWHIAIQENKVSEDDALASGKSFKAWDSTKDFTGPATTQLSVWEQLAQVLLLSNEFIFVE